MSGISVFVIMLRGGHGVGIGGRGCLSPGAFVYAVAVAAAVTNQSIGRVVLAFLGASGNERR